MGQVSPSPPEALRLRTVRQSEFSLLAPPPGARRMMGYTTSSSATSWRTRSASLAVVVCNIATPPGRPSGRGGRTPWVCRERSRYLANLADQDRSTGGNEEVGPALIEWPRIPPRRQAKPRQRWPLARQVGSFVPTDVAVPAPLWKSPGLGGDHARTQGGRPTRGRTAAAQPR